MIENNYAITCFHEIVDHFDISVSYLNKCFKEYVHTPPGGSIRKIKIEKAVNLLTYSQIPIEEIAVNTGYSETSTFTREFKKIYKIAPKPFIKLWSRRLKNVNITCSANWQAGQVSRHLHIL